MRDIFKKSIFNTLKISKSPKRSLLLPKRMKITKFGKLVTNLHDKGVYVVHMRSSKHGLVLKKGTQIKRQRKNHTLIKVLSYEKSGN